MRRFAIAATALLLLLFGAQAVLAQYGPNGSLTVTPANTTPGASVDVAGDGFAPSSTVHITIESTPVLLATVTADGAGAFTLSITIPMGYDGVHHIVATGTDAQDSVLVLQSSIMVTGAPSTNTLSQVGTDGSSDLPILAFSGVGIVLLTAGVLLITRRQTAR
jgi:hypothetical protein